MIFCFFSECELELICKLGSELVFKRGESCWRWDRRVCVPSKNFQKRCCWCSIK